MKHWRKDGLSGTGTCTPSGESTWAAEPQPARNGGAWSQACFRWTIRPYEALGRGNIGRLSVWRANALGGLYAPEHPVRKTMMSWKGVHRIVEPDGLVHEQTTEKRGRRMPQARRGDRPRRRRDRARSIRAYFGSSLADADISGQTEHIGPSFGRFWPSSRPAASNDLAKSRGPGCSNTTSPTRKNWRPASRSIPSMPIGTSARPSINSSPGAVK